MVSLAHGPIGGEIDRWLAETRRNFARLPVDNPVRRQGLEAVAQLTRAITGQPMTLGEAAADLGITPDTLRQAIRRGALEGTKRGRDWFITGAALERYRLYHHRPDLSVVVE